MTYQEFKAKRDEIESELHEKNLKTKSILSVKDFDYLLYLIDEYSELTRQMLQFIKSPKTGLVDSAKEKLNWENPPELPNEEEEESWLSHYFALDK